MRKQTYSLDIVICAAALFLAAGLAFVAPLSAQTAKPRSDSPTPVAGESWLQHLRRSFDETSMGKTGRLGPAEDGIESTEMNAEEVARTGLVPSSRVGKAENRTVVLHGSDLYRMNCRGCHGENGAGAPPEINSVINPVRATSAAVIMERMKSTGADMTPADAAKLAQQSKTMLLDRLHHGGQDMPAFPHLSSPEISSLVAYLRLLAGVRGAEAEQLAVREQRVRVGEHIAKSTCHICHSAAGPNPTAQELYAGAIPPLSTLTMRTNRDQFIRKVTHGAPIEMGEPRQRLRGRMPVFYYLSEEEAADVYMYLASFPPYPYAVIEAANAEAGHPVARAEDNATSYGARPVTSEPAIVVPGASAAADSGRAPITQTESHAMSFSILAGLVVMLLLGLAFAFTVCELQRLGGSRTREEDAENIELKDVEQQFDSELVA